jgi:hypothetical protein
LIFFLLPCDSVYLGTFIDILDECSEAFTEALVFLKLTSRCSARILQFYFLSYAWFDLMAASFASNDL